MIGYQPITVQHIICTQSGCIGFLAIGTFSLRLLFLLRLSALTHYYRHNGSMYVRCGFVHVKNCGNGVLLSESLVQPLHTIVTPFIYTSVLLYLHHVLVRSRQHNTNSPYLVRRNFALDACRLDAVGYRFVTFRYSFGKLYKFPIEMRSCGVNVRRYHPAFNVVGHPGIGCAFCFLEIKGKISHIELHFFVRQFRLPCIRAAWLTGFQKGHRPFAR